MRAGQLRHEIILQEITYVQDGYGGTVVKSTWADIATVRALVEPLRGREYYDAQQINAELSMKVLIRYYPGVAPKWRIKWGTRILEIVEVLDIAGRLRSLQLLCSEVLL